MSQPFIGEIGILPYNFSPYGWAYCSGQTISMSQNMALYAIIGNTFGGSPGQQTFAVPKLQSAVVPVGMGAGPGLRPWAWGEMAGTASYQLTNSQIPSHDHATKFALGSTSTSTPNGNYLGGLREETAPGAFQGRTIYEKTTAANVTFPPAALLPAGGNGAHENQQPYLALNFCIALDGNYPARS